MAKEEEEKRTQVSSQKAQAVSESHKLDNSTMVPVAWQWKNISGEAKRPLFKLGPRIDSQTHILLLNITKLQPTHQFLQPLHPPGPSALQDGHDVERLPMTSPFGLSSCFFFFWCNLWGVLGEWTPTADPSYIRAWLFQTSKIALHTFRIRSHPQVSKHLHYHSSCLISSY